VSFKPYPKYKESGVEWLGRLPEHWEVKRLKQVARTQIRNGVGAAADSAEEGNPRYVRITDIKGPRALHDDTFRSLPPEVAKDAAFQVGDVLFACVGATFGKSYLHVVDIGSVCYAGYLARFSPATNCEPRFIGHWAESASYWSQLNANVIQSTVQNFSASKYSELWIAVPSKAEQASVSDFLDHETAKIDALIAEQQRLIELLQEKRQAVISHAVTKGLNPDAPMKDSRIEWLGQVPEHWEIVRLGHRGRLQNGLSIGGEAFGAGDPFVSYGDVYKNTVVPNTPSGLVQSTADDQDKYGLEVGDVLFTRTSESADDIGVAATCLRAIPRSTFAGFLIRFRPYPGTLDPGYSKYLFRNQGVQGHFAGTMNLVTRASLSQGELRSLPICVPPIPEQVLISAALDERVEQLRVLTADTESAISLLQERRSALISAAVTGQIDVRGFTAGGTEAA
jgi:type I restriction enzyme S subunit